MTKSLDIRVSGGSVSIGNVIQGGSIAISGDTQVETSIADVASLRQALLDEAARRALPGEEVEQLKQHIQRLEDSLRQIKPEAPASTLQTIRKRVEDLRGAFGWATPLLKQFLSAQLPVLADLF